jgi:hypothetical protein
VALVTGGVDAAKVIVPLTLYQRIARSCEAAHFARRRRPGKPALRCAFVGGRLDVPALPLHVRDLEQSDVVFEANLIKFIKRQIVRHRFPQILGGEIKLSEFRGFHVVLNNDVLFYTSRFLSWQQDS